MGTLSKLMGSIVGSALGWAVARFGLPADLASPEVVGSIVGILSAAMTYIFPKNAD